MSPPWMPFYIRDYLADTSHLRAIESGAYLHLIMAYWVGGRLPNDDMQLATIAKMTRIEWARARHVLEPFFGPGFSSHKRIDLELARAAEVSASYAARASHASKKRWDKQASIDASSMPQALLEQSLSMPSSHTQKKEKEEKKGSEAIASDAGASPKPVYTDSKHELWGEGIPILISLGVPDKSARSNIGRWLRDAKDDAQSVLGAIQRARDNRVIEPVAWITRAIKPGSQNVEASRSLTAVSRRAAADAARAAGLDHDAGEPLLRIVSES